MKQIDSFSQEIKPAQKYKSVDDLWVITSFFDSQHYSSKYENYTLFINSLETTGINYLVIECAFLDQPFSLPDLPSILKVRSNSILWQKERLLNIAVASLPASCTKVAWVDCDVLFENESWAVETSKLLDDYTIVQPFEFVIRLPKGASYYEGKGDRWESFASIYQKTPNQLPESNFFLHGHTGFAWAARRDILAKHGLYDTCISGSADHLMVHAFSGDFYSQCINRLLGENDFTIKHFQEWAQDIYPNVLGKIKCVPGTLLHLWHGDLINRRYRERNQELAQFKYNPYTNIILNSDGCWEWNYKNLSRNKIHILEEWAVSYYKSRKEDG